MAKDFNFARKPFENERLPRLVFTLAATLVLGVTMVHGFFLARYLVREQEALDIKVVELRETLAATNADIGRTEANLARQQTALGDERTQFLTRIYRHKSFSWTGLFNELEEITPAAVRITSIAPVEEDGGITVTMSLVGRTLTNVLEMVQALEASAFFANVFPLDEVDLAEVGNTGETGIAATLQLHYVAAAPPEDPDIAPEDPQESGEADVASDSEELALEAEDALMDDAAEDVPDEIDDAIDDEALTDEEDEPPVLDPEVGS